MTTKFSERIKKLRRNSGLSQKEAAAKLSVSQAQLSHYENGIRECGLPFIVKLSELYGVSCDYILGATKDKSKASSLHPEAAALDALLTAADKMTDASSAIAVKKAADCCVSAIADAVFGEGSGFDRKCLSSSLGAASVLLSQVSETVTLSNENVENIEKTAESAIKDMMK